MNGALRPIGRRTVVPTRTTPSVTSPPSSGISSSDASSAQRSCAFEFVSEFEVIRVLRAEPAGDVEPEAARGRHDAQSLLHIFQALGAEAVDPARAEFIEDCRRAYQAVDAAGREVDELAPGVLGIVDALRVAELFEPVHRLARGLFRHAEPAPEFAR